MSGEEIQYCVVISNHWSGNLSREYFDAWLKKGAIGRVSFGGRNYTQKVPGGDFIDWDGNVLDVCCPEETKTKVDGGLG